MCIQTGLMEQISKKSDFTLFAPINGAWLQLRDTLDVTQSELLGMQNLTDILSYHIVDQKVCTTHAQHSEVSECFYHDASCIYTR